MYNMGYTEHNQGREGVTRTMISSAGARQQVELCCGGKCAVHMQAYYIMPYYTSTDGQHAQDARASGVPIQAVRKVSRLCYTRASEM